MKLDSVGTEQLIVKSQTITIEEQKFDMKSDKEKEKEKSHPIMIVGSNNVIGKNVFLINTDSDQDVQAFLKYLPPEVWDAMVLQMTRMVSSDNNT